MVFLRILRGVAATIVSCIMFAIVSALAITGYRIYQMRTLDHFVPESFVELLQGPTKLHTLEDLYSIEQEDAPQSIIEPLPVLSHLTGELPVGRWECFIGHHDFEKNRKTNQPDTIHRCQLIRNQYIQEQSPYYAISFHPDYSGYLLSIVDSRHTLALSKAGIQRVKLINSPHVYVHLQEIRWGIDGHDLVLQTHEEYRYCLSVLNENVIDVFVHCRFVSEKYISQAVTQYVLVRIGSPEYTRFSTYRDCIHSNKGRNLWEVRDCGIPFDVS